MAYDYRLISAICHIQIHIDEKTYINIYDLLFMTISMESLDRWISGHPIAAARTSRPWLPAGRGWDTHPAPLRDPDI